MKKRYIIGAVLIFLLILLAIFLYYRGDGDGLAAKRNKLQADLLAAEEKLKREKNLLDGMEAELRDTYQLALNMQDEMRKVSDIVGETDFMFNDPNGLNPELRLSISSSLLINSERRDINLLLAEWKQKTDILFLSKLNLAEARKIRDEAALIKQYLDHLIEMVKGMTPSNTGLSKVQIDLYASSIPATKSIDEVIDSLEASIDIFETQVDVTPEVNNENPSNTPEPTTKKVTPDDVVKKQKDVDDAEKKVTEVEDEIKKVDDEIGPTTPTPTPPPPTDTETDTDTDTDTEQDPGGEVNPNPTPRVFNKTEGIIPQEGEPRLIQGTDPY